MEKNRVDEKLAGIDLLRFASALAVLFWHYQHFAFIANEPANFSRAAQPFYPLLRLFYEFGLYGVQVFCCISGFVFFWKYGQALAERRVGARSFFVLRFSRLYPLHLITLLVVAAGQAVYAASHPYFFVYRDNSVTSFLLQLGMASHWFFPYTGFSFNAPIWSVSTELLCYLVFFVLTRYAGAGARTTLVTLALLAGLRVWTDLPVVDFLVFFYLGGAVALAWRAAAALDGARRTYVNAGLGVALLVLGVAAQKAWIKPEHVTFALAPLLIYLLLQYVRPAAGGRAAAVLAGLGNLTYASYLLHFPLQLGIAVVCGWLGRPIPWQSPALLIGWIGATMLLSVYCYRYVEVPLQAWIRRRWLN